ncbi:MAG: hypothetical protein ACOYOV_13495 [Bacteroidales bacterium]
MKKVLGWIFIVIPIINLIGIISGSPSHFGYIVFYFLQNNGIRRWDLFLIPTFVFLGIVFR